MRMAELDVADPECATFTLPSERSKNGRAIRVPLSPLALAALTPAIAGRPALDEKAGQVQLVITTTGFTPASGWSKAKARLDSLIAMTRAQRAAEEGREPTAMEPWRLHDLRRSFACTWLARFFKG